MRSALAHKENIQLVAIRIPEIFGLGSVFSVSIYDLARQTGFAGHGPVHNHGHYEKVVLSSLYSTPGDL